ncbi:MAG: 8-oxo-dGTP diphosphatase [Clostridia bacterium]
MFQVEMTNICMVHDVASDRVVIEHRVKSWKGVAFPGGHIEPGEGLVSSVIREVKEETGLTLEKPVFCGMIHWESLDTNERTLIACFRATRFSGTLLSGTSEGKVEWMPRAALRTLPLASGFGEQLRIFEDDSVCECFYQYRTVDGNTQVCAVTWY